MMRRRVAGGPGGREEGAHRYRMRERLVSIGDDYWIEDYAGERVFKVDGKALRLRSTLIIQNKEGQDLYQIQEKMLRIKDTMEIERAGGGVAATIKKALIAPLRDRWTVRVADDRRWMSRETSWTTSTGSAPGGTGSLRSRRSGSGSGTPTAWRLPRDRTTH